MKIRAALATSLLCAASFTCLGELTAASAVPDTLELVSVDSAGVQGNGNSSGSSLSRDSRFVAFQSDASNLVAGDTNGTTDVFVRDRLLGTTKRVSVDSAGQEGDGASFLPRISGNGRFVTFESEASNLVASDTNGATDIFVHELQTDPLPGPTERVSVSTSGTQSNGPSPTDDGPSINNDGCVVTFPSAATNLVTLDVNGKLDYFLRDRCAATPTTELITVSSLGVQGTGDTAGGFLGPSRATVSDDGNRVAFSSKSNNLAGVDLNGDEDVFVRDRAAHTTTLVSANRDGLAVGRASIQPVISGDGWYIAFTSGGLNIADPVNSFGPNVLVRDMHEPFPPIEVVSVSNDGRVLSGNNYRAAMSPDGRRIAWNTDSFTDGDLTNLHKVMVRDLDGPTTERASAPAGGGETTHHSVAPVLSAHPGLAAWEAYGDDLAPGDSNGNLDIVVKHGRDLTPPVITPVVSGTLGDNGWYTSDVNVSWTVTDPESSLTSQAGCDSTTLSTDTTAAGVTYTCHAMSAALPTSVSITIKRDATPPVINHTIEPASPDGMGGWYTSSPTVTFDCADPTPGSGLTSCLADGETGPSKSLGESAASQSVDGTAIDAAGNSSQDSAENLLVDLVDPTIGHTIAPAAPDGDNGWYVTAPTVTYDCDDTASGVGRCVADGSDPASSAVTLGESPNPQPTGGTVTDVAGRSATDSTPGVLVDLTNPTVTCPTPAPVFHQGQSGAQVTATVTDAASGPVTSSVSGPAGTSAIGIFTSAVTGHDVAGRSTAASCGYRVIGVPGAPVIGQATAGTGQATVKWTAPASDGGSPITGYIVTPYIGSTAQPERRFDSTATQQSVTGLTKGTSYTFKVAAINGVGTGAQSAASNAVKPK